MTSEPCNIDAGKSVAYAAKMMQATAQVVTIDPQQDLDEALRITAKQSSAPVFPRSKRTTGALVEGISH